MKRAWRVWSAAVALGVSALVGVGPALGQAAPAGNERPQAQAVTASGKDLGNPFGEPAKLGDRPAPTGEEQIREKFAFARKLAEAKALEPLRTLAVQHDGRVKVLDTLARETVLRIAGRRDYFDVIPRTGAGGKIEVEKLSYEPMFTWLDLMVDPLSYAEKPLVYVEYLPLRDAYLEAGFPGQEETQRKYRKITRLPVMVAARHFDAMANKYGTEQAYAQALGKVQTALSLISEGSANLLLVAPERSDEKYAHVSTLPDDSPVRRALADLGAAWRARDVAGVSKAAGVLAAELPTINSATYPASRRQLEYTYNRVNAFEYGYWMYLVALVSLVLAFGTGRRWLIGVGVGTLTLAVALHGFGFAARCLIAERFAIQNQFESMTGLSLFGALVGLGIMLAKRQWLFGAAAAGVGFLVLITATQTAIPGKIIEREAAILNTSVLLKYHVTTVLASYGLITLGMIISLFYLGVHYAARLRGGRLAAVGVSGAGGAGAGESMASVALNLDGSAPAGTQRTLHDLDRAQMTVLQLAFWTLGVGILLGAWWADHSWGRWWAFDPKETWALITWIVYLITIHMRFTGVRNKGLTTAWLSVIGFIVMLWCYFGVNLLLPGLHAYA